LKKQKILNAEKNYQSNIKRPVMKQEHIDYFFNEVYEDYRAGKLNQLNKETKPYYIVPDRPLPPDYFECMGPKLQFEEEKTETEEED